MRGLPLIALLAAGAVALPHRLGASAVKKVGHVHPRRTAPSLAALEADVDKLSSLTFERTGVGEVLAGFALGAAIDALVNKFAKKAGDAAGAGVRRMFQTAEDEDGAEIPLLMAAENEVGQACIQLLAHKAANEAAEDAGEEPLALDWDEINVEAELGALGGAWQLQDQDGDRVSYINRNGVPEHQRMVENFEAAKSAYMAAKRLLMQIMYVKASAYTKTKYNVEVDEADLAV